MSTTAMTASAYSRTVGAGRIRFRDLLAAEWIKMRSLRSTLWGYGMGILGVVFLNINGAAADYSNWHQGDAHDPMDGLHDVFTNNAHMVVLLIFGTLGAIVMVGEYSSGLIRPTLAAVPHRRAVVAAKSVVLTAVTTAAGVVMVAASYAVTQMMLAGRYGSLGVGHPGVLRMMAASVLLVPLSALVGMGLGALIRNSATTVFAVAALLALGPSFVESRNHAWINDIHNALPFYAWQRLGYPLHPPHFPGEFAPPTIGGSWLVYLLWSATAVIIAFAAVEARDV